MPVVIFCLSIPINKKEDNKKNLYHSKRGESGRLMCISSVLIMLLLKFVTLWVLGHQKELIEIMQSRFELASL